MTTVVSHCLHNKENTARGNRTSPVQASCPAGLLTVNQQDEGKVFIKVIMIDYHKNK
ncbi:hypothetical protein EZS27_006279 [termite gut metagenome]|uniref:Uncharacterized protein n=1 Tax=termite gut metagenome TaxID=433724 RepID=A0A5J4SJ06_9ZZZZ